MGQIISHKMFNSFLLVKVGKAKKTENGKYLIIIILLLKFYFL